MEQILTYTLAILAVAFAIHKAWPWNDWLAELAQCILGFGVVLVGGWLIFGLPSLFICSVAGSC